MEDGLLKRTTLNDESRIKEIEQFKKFYEDGIISEEEYEIEIQKINDYYNKENSKLILESA